MPRSNSIPGNFLETGSVKIQRILTPDHSYQVDRETLPEYGLLQCQRMWAWLVLQSVWIRQYLDCRKNYASSVFCNFFNPWAGPDHISAIQKLTSTSVLRMVEYSVFFLLVRPKKIFFAMPALLSPSSARVSSWITMVCQVTRGKLFLNVLPISKKTAILRAPRLKLCRAARSKPFGVTKVWVPLLSLDIRIRVTDEFSHGQTCLATFSCNRELA